jgi:quinol-cytochrome oxidoreductase complex cytochrome b subunit
LNEQDKQAYLEKYRQAKEKGVPFFPNILFKDAIAALLVFILLAALAFFIGAPLEERANPADTTYTPRPEVTEILPWGVRSSRCGHSSNLGRIATISVTAL